MGFSITEIMSQISKNKFANAARYEVAIYGYNNKVVDSTPEMMLNCSQLNVPGVNIGFQRDGKRYGIGLEKNLPTNKNYTDLTMTFYESEKEIERKYFIDWMDAIYDRESRRFNFYQDFIKDIHITQYSKTGEKTYSAIAKEAWVTNVSPLDRAYSNNEQIAQFNVSLQIFDLIETTF